MPKQERVIFQKTPSKKQKRPVLKVDEIKKEEIKEKEKKEEEKKKVEDTTKRVDEELVKENIKEEKKNIRNLEDLLQSSKKVLFKASTFFPLNFFPDEVVIEPDKVTVTVRIFFFTGEVRSMEIVDVEDVTVEAGPFFATLIIVEKSKVSTLIVKYLKTGDAIKARRIIQGLVLANKGGIDLSKIKDEELLKRVEELGRAREITQI